LLTLGIHFYTNHCTFYQKEHRCARKDAGIYQHGYSDKVVRGILHNQIFLDQSNSSFFSSNPLTSSSIMRQTFSTSILFAASALAAYTVVDDYSPDTFASKFDFFTGDDPTTGYVNYVDYDTATSEGLYSVSNNQVYMGVNYNDTASGRGRDSVRISSKDSYQHGLIVLDLAHMPASTCGTWPAFWLLSTSAAWPNGGEVDIIEGVNTQNTNSMTVHTSSGCSISSNSSAMTGELVTDNCDVAAPNQLSNQGCSIESGNTNSYGDGFNAIGGGVYATEWTSSGISVWFFPRGAIPADLSSGTPEPSSWGLPTANFAGACDWDEKVVNQQIVFDITFCGDWAGNDFLTDATCSSKASTCQDFVQNNPEAFAESFWSINSLKVYQNNEEAQASATLASSALASVSESTTIATTAFTSTETTLLTSSTSIASSDTTTAFASTATALATSSVSVASSETTVITSTATTLLTSSVLVTSPDTTLVTATLSSNTIQSTTTSTISAVISVSSAPAATSMTTAAPQGPTSTTIFTSYRSTFSTVTTSNTWGDWSSHQHDNTGNDNAGNGNWGSGSRWGSPRPGREML